MKYVRTQEEKHNIMKIVLTFVLSAGVGMIVMLIGITLI